MFCILSNTRKTKHWQTQMLFDLRPGPKYEADTNTHTIWVSNTEDIFTICLTVLLDVIWHRHGFHQRQPAFVCFLIQSGQKTFGGLWRLTGGEKSQMNCAGLNWPLNWFWIVALMYVNIMHAKHTEYPSSTGHNDVITGSYLTLINDLWLSLWTSLD